MKRVLVLLLTLFGSTAVADSEEPTDTTARSHWERAEARYKAGDYSIAIAEYKAGYAIEPKRIFLFGLAQSERKLGNCAAGDEHFNKFVATDMTDDQRAAAKTNLVECTSKEPPKPPPPNPPPPKPAPEPTQAWYRDAIGGVITVAGLATVGVGIAYGVASNRAVDGAPSQATIDDYEDALERGRSHKRMAKIVIPVGAGVIAIGVLRYLLVGRSSPERPRAASRPRPQLFGWATERGAGFVLAGRL